jgi:hypothetical protein
MCTSRDSMSFDTGRTCELLVVDEDHLCDVLSTSLSAGALQYKGMVEVVVVDAVEDPLVL